MVPVLKIAGLAAILTAGFVAISEAPVSASAPAAKVFYDRVTDAPGTVQQVRFADAASAAKVAPVVNRSVKGDAAPVATARPDCSVQAWPYKSAECLTGAEGAPARKPVRTIAINAAR